MCIRDRLKNVPPRVVLLQKGDRLLPELNHKSLSEFTLSKLRKNGIDVRLETSAQKADSIAVHLTTGERIETGMIVCTVGTQTHPLLRELGLSLIHIYALTPLLTASTPVMAVQPLANDRSRTHNPTPAVATGRAGGARRGWGCPLLETDLATPRPNTMNMLATNR